jgi:hypothetical protein
VNRMVTVDWDWIGWPKWKTTSANRGTHRVMRKSECHSSDVQPLPRGANGYIWWFPSRWNEKRCNSRCFVRVKQNNELLLWTDAWDKSWMESWSIETCLMRAWRIDQSNRKSRPHPDPSDCLLAASSPVLSKVSMANSSSRTGSSSDCLWIQVFRILFRVFLGKIAHPVESSLSNCLEAVRRCGLTIFENQECANWTKIAASFQKTAKSELFLRHFLAVSSWESLIQYLVHVYEKITSTIPP